jgi:ribosomal protein L30
MVDSVIKMVRVKQIGSPIRRNGKQCLNLRSLGLRGIGSERELVANSTVLGLLRRVRHLVAETEVMSDTCPAVEITKKCIATRKKGATACDDPKKVVSTSEKLEQGVSVERAAVTDANTTIKSNE